LRVDTAAAFNILVNVDLLDDWPPLTLDIQPQAEHQPFLIGLLPVVKLGASVHHCIIVEEARFSGLETGFELQSLGRGTKGVDGFDFLGREFPPQLAERRFDDLADQSQLLTQQDQELVQTAGGEKGEFESTPLQRGVFCEPDPLDQGAELQLAGHRMPDSHSCTRLLAPL